MANSQYFDILLGKVLLLKIPLSHSLSLFAEELAHV